MKRVARKLGVTGVSVDMNKGPKWKYVKYRKAVTALGLQKAGGFNKSKKVK